MFFIGERGFSTFFGDEVPSPEIVVLFDEATVEVMETEAAVERMGAEATERVGVEVRVVVIGAARVVRPFEGVERVDDA